MNLLIDSHVFIWSYDEQHKLSRNALQAMSDPTNNLFLSLVSIWEIQIKIMLGNSNLPTPSPTLSGNSKKSMASIFYPSACRIYWHLKIFRPSTKTRLTVC